MIPFIFTGIPWTSQRGYNSNYTLYPTNCSLGLKLDLAKIWIKFGHCPTPTGPLQPSWNLGPGPTLSFALCWRLQTKSSIEVFDDLPFHSIVCGFVRTYGHMVIWCVKLYNLLLWGKWLSQPATNLRQNQIFRWDFTSFCNTYRGIHNLCNWNRWT